MIHFYEQFVKIASARNSTKTSSSIDTTSPTVQLSVDSRRRGRAGSMSSDTTARAGMHSSPDTMTTLSNVLVMRDDIFARSSAISPLTPSAKDRPATSTRRRQGGKSSRLLDAQNNRQRSDRKENKMSEQHRQINNPTKTRLSMYERSQLRLKEREKKIETLREEMMKDCTFRPDTSAKDAVRKGRNMFVSRGRANKKRDSSVDGDFLSRQKKHADSRSTPTSTTATTPTTTSTSRSAAQYWQDLQSKQQQRQHRHHHPHQHCAASAATSKDGSMPSKLSSTTRSSRFEDLYQDGVRKARQRPPTEKVSCAWKRCGKLLCSTCSRGPLFAILLSG